MEAVYWLLNILVILGGVVALSSLIVSKSPNAKQYIDKLVAYQALIGVAMLALAVVALIHFGPVNQFRLVKLKALLGLSFIGATYSGILLGFFFGMPQIAKWIPGESSAEAKALELSKKIAPILTILGAVALASGIIWLFYRL